MHYFQQLFQRLIAVYTLHSKVLYHTVIQLIKWFFDVK